MDVMTDLMVKKFSVMTTFRSFNERFFMEQPHIRIAELTNMMTDR